MLRGNPNHLYFKKRFVHPHLQFDLLALCFTPEMVIYKGLWRASSWQDPWSVSSPTSFPGFSPTHPWKRGCEFAYKTPILLKHRNFSALQKCPRIYLSFTPSSSSGLLGNKVFFGGEGRGGGGRNKPSLAICFQVEEEAIGNRGTKILLTWMHSLSRDQ